MTLLLQFAVGGVLYVACAAGFLFIRKDPLVTPVLQKLRGRGKTASLPEGNDE